MRGGVSHLFSPGSLFRHENQVCLSHRALLLKSQQGAHDMRREARTPFNVQQCARTKTPLPPPPTPST